MHISGSAIFPRSPNSCHFKLHPSITTYILPVTKPHHFLSQHASSLLLVLPVKQTRHSPYLKNSGALLASHPCLWELVPINLFCQPPVYVCPSQSSISIMLSFSLFKGLKWLSSAHNCQQSLQDFKTFHSQDKALVLTVNPDLQAPNGEWWMRVTGGICNFASTPDDSSTDVLLFNWVILIWSTSFSHLSSFSYSCVIIILHSLQNSYHFWKLSFNPPSSMKTLFNSFRWI